MISVYVDDDGILRMTSEESWEHVLAAFFEQDIQNSKECLRLIEMKLGDALEDENFKWSGTGNAHTITIMSTQVIIENEYIDSDCCELERGIFIKVLNLWKELVDEQYKQ